MKIKFDEFYFENDKNYTADVYWDLYDKDSKKAREKYDGHMFCPLCKSAPLTVARGNQLKYFKVVKSDMEKHDRDCSYRNEKATKKETHNFYEKSDITDIRNRLVSCLNRMLKSVLKDTNKRDTIICGENKSENNFLNFKGDSGKIKYLPHKNLNSKDLDEEMDIQKIYYGECALYIYKYVSEGEVKKYYLKVLKISSKELICEITISPAVYKYLSDELDSIPEDKNMALNYYLCFSGVLEKNKNLYKCILRDSRLMILEKA